MEAFVGWTRQNRKLRAGFFPDAGNLNASNADMCSDTAGPSNSGSGVLFELLDRSKSHTFTISATTNTYRQLGFELDYNSHTAFQGVLRHYT